MSKQRDKGTKFETACAAYLSAATGQEVTRRPLSGSQDKGDLRGLKVRDEEITIECKNCNKIEIAEWLRQARRESANALTDYGVVIFHRKGVGLTMTSMGDQGVLMDLDTFSRLIGCDEE